MSYLITEAELDLALEAFEASDIMPGCIISDDRNDAMIAEVHWDGDLAFAAIEKTPGWWLVVKGSNYLLWR